MSKLIARYFTSAKSFNFILSPTVITQKRCSSVLFIPGNKAHESFAFISPFLDFDKRFKNIEKLQKDLASRGINIDAENMKKTWEFYKFMDSNKNAIELKRSEIAKRVRKLRNKKEVTQEEEAEINSLTIKARVLKQDLKMVKEALWEMEENVVIKALKLPNEIDENTPRETSVVLKSVGIKSVINDNKKENHIDIGQRLGLVDYKNPIQCYFSNEAVSFEIGVLNFAAKILKEYNMIRVSGPDFSRSLILEGTGIDHENSSESFILKNDDITDKFSKNNRLHLVGGASLPSFLAILTKQVINPKSFPIKFFATGRQYTPVTNNLTTSGLFTICQASTAHALTLVKANDIDDYKKEFQNLIEAGMKIYNELDCHYRVVMRSAGELRPWETMRVSFEMWSSSADQYIEVGHVSTCGDFFNKRLLIAYQTSSGRDFPNTVSGTLICVPRVLGCLLEDNPEKFKVPEKIAQYAF